jgi:hypothetical protein
MSRSATASLIVLAVFPQAALAAYRVTVAGTDVRIEEASPLAAAAGDRGTVLQSLLPLIGDSRLQVSVARSLGNTQLLGKSLPAPAVRPIAPAVGLGEIDHLVSGDPASAGGLQSEASVAVNPVDQSVVVVFAQNTGNPSGLEYACTVYLSLDGGLSWAYAFDAPGVAPPRFCSSPVARFSPDGAALYLAYLDYDKATATSVLRLDKRDGFDPRRDAGSSSVDAGPHLIDKPWIDVHTFDNSGNPGPGPNAAYLYLTATLFNTATRDCDILYVQYTGYMSAVGSAMADLAHGNCTPPTPMSPGFRLVQGARAAGGPGNDVLVCWYDSGTDGWSTGAQLYPEPGVAVKPLNTFNIACRSSDDNGASFAGNPAPPEAAPGSWIYAARQVPFEVAFWLGPNANYFRYWASQFPSLTIDHTGQAHIVFTFNLGTANRFGPDQGNVAYLHTTGAPTTPRFTRWANRTTIAAGFGAQFFPTVTAQRVAESPTRPYIYIAYADTTRSQPLGNAQANSIYDIRYRLSTNGGTSFAAPVLVTDHASVSDQLYIGDSIDATANAGVYDIAWTDNRYAPGPAAPRTHVFLDRY